MIFKLFKNSQHLVQFKFAVFKPILCFLSTNVFQATFSYQKFEIFYRIDFGMSVERTTS